MGVGEGVARGFNAAVATFLWPSAPAKHILYDCENYRLKIQAIYKASRFYLVFIK